MQRTKRRIEKIKFHFLPKKIILKIDKKMFLRHNIYYIRRKYYGKNTKNLL